VPNVGRLLIGTAAIGRWRLVDLFLGVVVGSE